MVDIIYGTMRTPAEEANVKALYKRMQMIMDNWSIVSPSPEFKMTKDKFGQVHLYFNDRMLTYVLMAFSKLEDTELPMPDDGMPDWFDALMSGKPYVNPNS